MDMDAKLARAAEWKARGTALFGAGRLRRAERAYREGARAFNFVLPTDKMTDPRQENRAINERGAAAAVPLLLNEALCMRKRGALRDAEINLNEVLEADAACAKAWFRRGQVRVGLDKWELARADLARAAELDASVAADVRRELRALWAKTASLDERDRRRYKHVFAKLAVYGDKDVDPRKLAKLRRDADRREA